MCQPSAITDNNMPPSAILGTYQHFRNFIMKTIYSGDYLVFPLMIIRSTFKWFYYILLKWFVELREDSYTSLDCELVERVCDDILLLPRSVVLSYLEEPMVKASCYRSLQSLVATDEVCRRWWLKLHARERVVKYHLIPITFSELNPQQPIDKP